MLSLILTSTIAFVCTNIDDIFVVALFYAQIDDEQKKQGKLKKQHVIMGQYLGVGILVVVSLLGAYGLNFVHLRHAGLLGLVPITLGIKAWVDYKKENIPSRGERGRGAKMTSHGILSVAAVVAANGGDNLGVYIPLFTGYAAYQILATILVFVFMTALWCFLGDKIASLPEIKSAIQKYEHIVIPIVFIALGMYIMMKNLTNA
jgi:cadmium resistance transport/sequestration family protein